MKKTCVFVIALGVMFSNCTPNINQKKEEPYTLPGSPVNMGEINSGYDDYNSTIPIMGIISPVVFSSNRNSNGQNFDFVYKLVGIYMLDGKLSISESSNQVVGMTPYSNQAMSMANSNLNAALGKINSYYDEYGPYLIPQRNGFGDANIPFQQYIFLFASNSKGNLDIKFTENVSDSNYAVPKNISFLNSAQDDAYPTVTTDSSALYFCSNRGGNFDIYTTSLARNGRTLINSFADSSAHVVSKDTDLSSGSDDKCPFIKGNLMVFTSNRPGGFGGFDLYYSVFANGKWSAPVNFGDKINTAYDEYRPITNSMANSTNDLMIFSSNRPGGKGGFDLYCVGVDKVK